MEKNILKLESLLNHWRHPSQDLSILTVEGQILISETHHATDLCSLPLSIQSIQSYLNLKPGELAITNDIACGSGMLTNITLATALRVPNSDNIFLLGTIISTRPHIYFESTQLDDTEKTLKIPPTPLGTLSDPNLGIVKLIDQNPSAPNDFQQKFLNGLDFLRTMVAGFSESCRVSNLEISRALIQKYILYQLEDVKLLLSEFPHGRSEVHWTFEGGEKLRLQIENTGSRLNLDFGGTGQLLDFHLSESQALGCVLRTLSLSSQHPLGINSGTLLAFNLAAPSHSLISNREGVGAMTSNLGVLSGSHLLCDLVFRALSLLHPRKRNLRSTSSPMLISMDFKNRSFFDSLPSGSFATAEKRGESAVETWHTSPLSLSVEDLEARFPLQILAFKLRSNSGGSGDQKGGDGILKTYKLTESARLRWFAGFPIKHETHSSSGLGDEAEISIKRPDQSEFNSLSRKGEENLPAGSIITAQSSGGHGFVK